MDQLVILQEIYESFPRGGETLSDIDPRSIEGTSAHLVGKLLEGSKTGRIDEDLCLKLVDSLEDVYEIKRLGDICRKAGLYALAIRSYNKALSLTRDQSVRPVLLNNLGQVYSRQGDPKRAAIYYQKSAEGFESIGDGSGLAHVLGNLGAAHRRDRNWDKAIEHSYRSLKAFEEMGDEFGAAQMNGGLGRIYAEMGERDLSARYFEKSLKDFQRLGDKKSAARIHDRLGRISSEMRNWDEAIKHYSKSLSIFDELGQSQSSGLVLSNLGRMYLEKGEASQARDSLERSLKLIRKDMRPAYQNAVASLAAAYSLTARGYLEERGPFRPHPTEVDGKIANNLKLASQFYAHASDRYQELSSLPKTDLASIKIASGISRSLSYMARLQADPSEQEAVTLAERAISALDTSAANSEGLTKSRIKELQRILTGMREVWSAALLKSEPWRLTKSLADATEYLMGAAGNAGGAGDYLSDALKSMRGAIDSERKRSNPSEQLLATSSYLRNAQKRLETSGIDRERQHASEICEAAEIIEGLTKLQSGQVTPSSADIANLLSYKAHRDALILIGWVLTKEVLSNVDDTVHIYTWDESLRLVEPLSEAKGKAGPEMEDQATEVEVEVEPKPFLDAFERRIEATENHFKPVIESVRASAESATEPAESVIEPAELVTEPVELVAEPVESMIKPAEPMVARAAAKEATVEGPQSGNASASKDGLWLIPVKSDLVYPASSAQMLLVPDERTKSEAIEIVEIFEPPAEIQTHERDFATESTGMHAFGDENNPWDPAKAYSPEEEAAKDEAESSASAVLEDSKSKMGETLGLLPGMFSQETALKAIKALAIAIIVLLAIEVILYLI